MSRSNSTKAPKRPSGKPSRLEPVSSTGWLEEREWRIPLAPAPEAALPLHVLRLEALLVGDPGWSPSRLFWGISPATGAQGWAPFLPGILAGVPRLWWCGRRRSPFAAAPWRVACAFRAHDAEQAAGTA